MKTTRKTLEILEVFLNTGKEISVNELAKITGQNVSTVHGILTELLKMGYVRQPQKKGKYSLGLKFLSFTNTINSVMNIEEIFQPYMIELREKVNETVNIAVREGNYSYSLAVFESNQRLRVVTNRQFGGRVPLYCTGIGKIFMAYMKNEELNDYLINEDLFKISDNTITDKDVLKEQIVKVKKEGIAYDFEECELGVHNIAAPVTDNRGSVIAAVGVLGPSVRLTRQKMKEIAPILKSTAEKISEELRGNNTTNKVR